MYFCCQVTAKLLRAKIYIDFGPHPGMDRFPREAALAGCMIVTNTQGAAEYYADVPIPHKYKFQAFDVYKIAMCLKEISKSAISLEENSELISP